MSTIIGGSSPSVTFPDSTVQDTSAIVGGKIPYANLPAGSVLQVVQGTYSTSTTISTGTITSTGLTATITPKFATSKILVLVTDQIRTSGGYGQFYFYRNSTNIYTIWASFNYSSNSGAYSGTLATNYLDSPATTSATSYTLYFSNVSGITAQIDGTVATITLLEIAG